MMTGSSNLREKSIGNKVVVMDKDLYYAAVMGVVSIFADVNVRKDPDYFHRRTSERYNIIHVAVQYEQLAFLKEAGLRFPELISEGNCDNNTPIHIAADAGNLSIVEQLVDCSKILLEVKARESKGDDLLVPWRMKNKEGNTPLHVALIRGELHVARFLVNNDPELTLFCNNLDEAPLHLAVKHHTADDKKSETVVARLKADTGIVLLTPNKYCPKLEEDSLFMIQLLLEANNSVACWRDANGATPLLRAVMLDPPHYLRAIAAILHYCPQSAGVCDATSGDTILHLLIKKRGSFERWSDNKDEVVAELFGYQNYHAPLYQGLKNIQDFAGNTPAHIAGKLNDSTVARWLLESSANFTIKNKEGIRAIDLIQDLGSIRERKYLRNNSEFNEESRAAENADVQFLMRRFYETGGRYLVECWDTWNGHNILHSLALTENPEKLKTTEVMEFINQAMETAPFLICQANYWGHTPLHYMVEKVPEIVDASFLDIWKAAFQKIKEEARSEDLYLPPWKAKDNRGDTPLHRALSNNTTKYGDYFSCDVTWERTAIKLRCATELLHLDDELVVDVNNNGCTPLHLLCNMFEGLSGGDNVAEDIKASINYIVTKSFDRTEKMMDNDGLNPLLRASMSHNFLLVTPLFTREGWSPLSLNRKRQSFFHLIASTAISESNYKQVEELVAMTTLETDFEHSYYVRCLPDINGNMPLHLAVETRNFWLAKCFFESFRSWSDADIIHTLIKRNSMDQTILHFIAKTEAFGSSDYQDLLEVVSRFTSEVLLVVLSIVDIDGNTALHLALRNRNFPFVNFCFQCIEDSGHDIIVVEVLNRCNADGQTILHLIADAGPSQNDYQELLSLVKAAYNQSNLRELFYIQDKDGNTALHLALEKNNHKFAEVCIETTADQSNRNILDIRNNNRDSPGDLIGSAKHLPSKFEQFLWSKPTIVEGMLGTRSLSGIPTTMIENYVNTLGVTAALLATITFTAAFAVPGGLNSNNGSPLLMTRPAFQVFMVSDILAMCLSMMVLFCLLWIMTVSDKKRSVVLLDLTVFLLEAAFYATLLTFMTGLYVTTFSITPWIAIFTCVLCSLLIVLMHKRFITGLIPNFVRLFVWSRKAYLSVGAFTHKSDGDKSAQPTQSIRTKQNTKDGNDNSGKPAQSTATEQQPQERASEQADAKVPPSDTKPLLIGSPPASAHMITIDGSKNDGHPKVH